jgi:hypothetical protein
LLANLLLASLIAGCAGKQPAPTQPSGAAGQPERPLEGKVVQVSPASRFVVLNFPIGRMPALGQRLDVYRHGVKSGEVKITGPVWDDAAVADIWAGDAEVGDLVREQ